MPLGCVVCRGFGFWRNPETLPWISEDPRKLMVSGTFWYHKNKTKI